MVFSIIGLLPAAILPANSSGALGGTEKRVGKLGKTVPALVRDLRDPQSRTLGFVIHDLGTSGDERAAQPLIDFARTTNSRRDKADAIEALGKLRAKQAVPAILGMLSDKDRLVQLNSGVALLRLGEDTTAYPLLESLAKAGDSRALQPLCGFFSESDRKSARLSVRDGRARAILTRALGFSNDEVRVTAASLLLAAEGRSVREQVYPVALDVLKNNRSAGAERERAFDAAIQVIEALGDSGAIPILEQRIADRSIKRDDGQRVLMKLKSK